MIFFLTPPFVQLNTPYPATPSLVGFLTSRGYSCTQRDLSLEVALDVLRTYGDDFTDEALEILQNPFLSPDQKVSVTQYLDDLSRKIQTDVDPDFGFSRYAEKISVALSDFSVLLKRLRSHHPVDRILEKKVRDIFERPEWSVERFAQDNEGLVVGITCPFPGTLLGAFRIARTLKKIDPRIRTVLGGGYVNTELRALNEPRVGEFFDAIMWDEGYAPWLEFLKSPHPQPIPAFVKPSYQGLDLSQYLDLPETENPMHRLWSTGRWLKIQLARGCYWHKCAFCDVTLDYVKCFEMPSAQTIADAMEQLIAQTHQTGFHFTDEALPPALIGDLSHELLRRKISCTWWGNIRFDTAFDASLVHLMKRAGCIAVSGGLECAVNRLLRLMNKGITCESATCVLSHFQKEGILVHAYLMYAFPTQTEREAFRALGFVRKLFRQNLIQSAFFHRFALTVHSPIAHAPEKFGIEIPPLPPPTKHLFAQNEIPYREASAPDWDALGKGLHWALANFMEGRGLSKPLSFWFR